MYHYSFRVKKVHTDFTSSLSQAILIEMLLTLMLVMVFIHTSMEKAELKSTSPALCGLTLAAGILAGYVDTKYDFFVYFPR